MKFETIVFDFGDTLATMRPSKENLLRDFLLEQGLDVLIDDIGHAYRIVDYCNKQSALKVQSPEKKKDFLLHVNTELMKVLGLSVKGASWPEAIYQHFSRNRNWELFPEVRQELSRLKDAGHRLGILANWDPGLEKIVERLGILDLFSLVLCSGEIGKEKPDADAFKAVLHGLSAEPEKALYVGNEYEVDVVGALNAGMGAVLIDRQNQMKYADCLKVSSLTGINKLI
jgi:HAD superfamily hydrolase (TIGR01549 family)